MRNPARITSLPFVCLTLGASHGYAQIELQGMTSAFASSVLERQQPAGQNPLLKAPLNRSTPPVPFLQPRFPAQPEFAWSSISPAYDDLIRIDAQSTGNDIIPTPDSSGTPNLPLNQSWLLVVASVSSGSQGTPSGILKELRDSVGDPNRDHGADLIGYTFQESVGIHPELVGATTLEQRREQQGFAPGADVTGLDFALGVQSFAQRTGQAVFTASEDFFFSLTPLSALLIQARQGQGQLPTFVASGAPASAAAIYRAHWNGQSWDPITEYRAPSALGLVATTHDLDAIAVDLTSGNTLFSTTQGAGSPPGTSQIRVHSVLGVSDLRDGTVGEVTTGLGVYDEIDDIDALCAIDPESGVFADLAGTPFEIPGEPVAPRMGISTSLEVNGLGEELHVVQVTGFGNHPQSGLMYVGWTADPFALTPTWTTLSVAPRWADDFFFETSYPLDQTSPLPGLEIGIQAAFVGLESDDIPLSWLSILRLP